MVLKELRRKIEELDKYMVSLLNERAQLSLQILQEKQKLGLAIYDPEREKQVIQNAVIENQGPLKNDQINLIFQVIIESCRMLQLNQKGIE